MATRSSLTPPPPSHRAPAPRRASSPRCGRRGSGANSSAWAARASPRLISSSSATNAAACAPRSRPATSSSNTNPPRPRTSMPEALDERPHGDGAAADRGRVDALGRLEQVQDRLGQARRAAPRRAARPAAAAHTAPAPCGRRAGRRRLAAPASHSAARLKRWYSARRSASSSAALSASSSSSSSASASTSRRDLSSQSAATSTRNSESDSRSISSAPSSCAR